MDHLCRLCTGNVLSADFVDLFENIELMEKVEKHLQMKCSQDEFGLPHRICNTCIYELEAFVNFFERCHSVQKALKIQSELCSNQDTDESSFKGEKIDTRFYKGYNKLSCDTSNNFGGNGAIVSTVPSQTPLLNQLVHCIKYEDPSETCMTNNLPASEIVAKVIVSNHVKEEEEDDDEVVIVDTSEPDSNDHRDDIIDVDDSDEQDTFKQTNKTKSVINSSKGSNQRRGGEWCQLNETVINNLLDSSENRNESCPNSGSRSSNTSACEDPLDVTRPPSSTRQTFVGNTSSKNHANLEKDSSSRSHRKRRRSSSSSNASDNDEGSRTEIVPSHKCGVCDRAFRRKVQLDLHLKTHSTKKTSDGEEEEDDDHEPSGESSGSEFSCGEENKSTKKSKLSELPSRKYILKSTQISDKTLSSLGFDCLEDEILPPGLPSQKCILKSGQISDKSLSSLGFDCLQDKTLLPSQHSKHLNRAQQLSATVKQNSQSILPFIVIEPVGSQSMLKNSQVSQNSHKPQQIKNTKLKSLPKQTHQSQSSPVSQITSTPLQVTSSFSQTPQIGNTPGFVLVGPFSRSSAHQLVQTFPQSQLVQQSQNSQMIVDVSSQHLKSLPVTSSSASLHDLQKNQNTQVSQVAPLLSSSISPQISLQSCGTSQITQVVPQQIACVISSTSQSHVSQQGNIISLSPQLQARPVPHTSTETSQSSARSPIVVPSTMQSQTLYIAQSSTQSQVAYQSQKPQIVHVLPSSPWTSLSTQSQISQKSSQILEAVSTVPYSSSTQSQLLLPSTQPIIVVAPSHQQLLQVQEHNIGQQQQRVQLSHTISKTTQFQKDQPIVNSCTPASLQFQEPKKYSLIPTLQQSQICRSFLQSQIMPIVQDLQPVHASQPSNSQEYPENHTTGLFQLTQPSQQIQDNKEQIYEKFEPSLKSLVPKCSDSSGLKQTMKSLQCEVGQPPPKSIQDEIVDPLPKHQNESSRIETEILCMEVMESDSDNETS